VARRQKISVKYLEQLVRKLKKAGMISSQRGPYGGHILAKSPPDITVGDIVRTLEENTAITDCAETDTPLCGVCNQAGDCLSRWVWVEASKAMFECLDNITVADLLQHRPVNVL
jgi:Rrf2 family protein